MNVGIWIYRYGVRNRRRYMRGVCEKARVRIAAFEGWRQASAKCSAKAEVAHGLGVDVVLWHSPPSAFNLEPLDIYASI